MKKREQIIQGSTIFMTGATSGLGKVSALKAANEGATLIIMARNKEKSIKIKTDYKNQYPDGKGKIDVVEGDLNSFKSVNDACKKVLSKYSVIDMIINNAGLMNFERTLTIDHIEETLQVNFLSHLLICELLFEKLKNSKSPKIIFTSSALHQGEINFNDLEFEKGFSSFKVYRQSKLSIILICRYLAPYLAKQNICIYSNHPGMVRTNLGRSAGWFSKLIFGVMGKSTEKGSKTLSYLISTPNSKLKSGEYYAGEKIKKTTAESYDLEVAKKLLNFSYKYFDSYLPEKSSGIIKLSNQ